MPSSPAPRLFLVRHGETAWSVTGRHTGRTDLPLTPAGERRATALRGRLGGEPFARVFTSPLQRARRTAALAGFADAEADADLVEWHYGDYEGLTSAQIRERNPAWDLYRDGGPNGETPADVVARAERFLARWAALDADAIAFSSGHFLRVLAACWLGLPVAAARGFYAVTGGVSTLGYEHGRDDRVILLWNDSRP